MRVLLVSDFFPPVAGGLEFHVQTLAAELARQGHDVGVVTLTDDPVAADAFTVSTVSTSVRLLPHDRSDRPFHPPLPDPIARHSIRRIVAEFRPDVIHAHSWLAASVPHGPVPLVFTAHDYGQVCQRRTMLQPELQRCNGPALRKCIACGSDLYGRAKSSLLAPATVAGRSLLRPKRIVAVSGAVRDALLPYVRAPIDVIPNFVAPPPPSQDLPADFPSSPYVFYAGDSAAHKGVLDLLDVWAGPIAPTGRLVMATPTPVDRPLPPHVINVSLTRAQVVAAMMRATAVVVPSVWDEPCPTVVLEAMQAGRPVIGSAVGGIPDLIDDGLTGVLVAPGDVVGFQTAIESLIADPLAAARMGEAARERCKSYDVAVVAEQLVSVYRAVASP